MTKDQARTRLRELKLEEKAATAAFEYELSIAGKNGNPEFSASEFWTRYRPWSTVLREMFNCIQILEGDEPKS